MTGRDAAIRMQSSYRWVIVAAGGLLGCVAIGAMFSLPVFLLRSREMDGRSPRLQARTIGFLALALASMLGVRVGPWGRASSFDRVRVLLRPALASRATSLPIKVVFGLVVGAGTAAIFAPMRPRLA